MADFEHATQQGYSADMDGQAHEAAYRGFVGFVEIATTVLACWVLALALGGVRQAWYSAILGVVLSSVAGAIGAFAPGLGWRAPLAVAVLLALMLLLY